MRGIYEFVEVQLPGLESSAYIRELEGKLIRATQAPPNGVECLIAVDSGFAEVTYAGARLGIINAVGMEFVSKSKMTVLKPLLLGKSIELSVEARAVEFDVAAQLISASRGGCVVLLDGTVRLNTDSGEYLRAKSILLSTARNRGAAVLAHSKDVTVNRYSGLDIDERMPLFVAMEENRQADGYAGVVLTVPISDGDLSSFYVQYKPHLLPMYVEAIEPLDPAVLALIGDLTTREGYPLPLYVVDRLSKLSGDVIRYVKLSISKLARGYGAIAVHETLREMLDKH